MRMPNSERLRRSNECSKQYQAANKAAGLCPCGQRPPRENKIKCQVCADQRTAWYRTHKEEILDKMKLKWLDMKEKVFAHYGAECVCCGETYLPFLAIDHIKAGGTKHRQQVFTETGSRNMYYWLIKSKFPVGFQTLCHNCNLAKGTKPTCPCPTR